MGMTVEKIDRLEAALGKDCSAHQRLISQIVLSVQEMVRDIGFDEDFLDWTPEDIAELTRLEPLDV